jgi:glycosyltransferase involved in cell wall biosynthesis
MSSHSNNPVDLSVVIPVYNEGPALKSVLNDLLNCLTASSVNFEIIIVDDSSTDNCVEHHFINSAPHVTVLRHAQRRGSGAARKTGAQHACGEWLGWIDADGTYDPRDLVRLWQARQPDTQLIGKRDNEAGSLRPLRWAAKGLLRMLASALWRTAIPDLNSGLRIIPRKHFQTWSHEIPDGFSCATAATLGSISRNQPVSFMTVRYGIRPYQGKSKFHPLIDSFRMLNQILSARVKRLL